MDRARAKELLPIIQAFADGKNIQYLDHSKRWSDCICDHVSFHSDDTYRIKPEPEVIYVNKFRYLDGVDRPYTTQSSARANAKGLISDYEYIGKKFIEAIE